MCVLFLLLWLQTICMPNSIGCWLRHRMNFFKTLRYNTYDMFNKKIVIWNNEQFDLNLQHNFYFFEEIDRKIGKVICFVLSI